MIHVLKKCENTKDKMLIQKYLNEEGKRNYEKNRGGKRRKEKREEESD